MAVAIITFFLGCILGITVASLCSAVKTGDDLISSYKKVKKNIVSNREV